MLNKYKEIWNRINQYKTITIFTHLDADGDTIGTSIALKKLIELNTANIEVKISGEKYPSNLKWLPLNDNVSDEYIKKSLAILVDASSIKRTFDKRILNSKEIIKIDHHHSEGNEWSLEISGDHWPATGEILYEMINGLNLKSNKVIWEALYVSIWTDTSGLIERNLSKQTFEAIRWLEENGIKRENIVSNLEVSREEKKLMNKWCSNAIVDNGFVYKINDEIISNDLYRPSTEIFFKKYDGIVYIYVAKEKMGQYRVGFKSKGFDVSKIAKKFGGGGHVTSAGTKVESLKEVNGIIKYTKELINVSK